MAYSRSLGCSEYAVLVFAHNAKEARVLAWRGTIDLTDEWTDLAIRRLWNRPWLYQDIDGVKADVPHVVDSPTGCKICEQWGNELFDGICEQCLDEIEENKNG